MKKYEIKEISKNEWILFRYDEDRGMPNNAEFQFWYQRNEIVEKFEQLKNKVSSLFDAIKHGDQDHQEWLKNKIEEHFK